MVIKTVVHFEIPAEDAAKLSKFYSDVFGWKFEKAQMPDMEYWMITTGPRNKSVGGGMYKKSGPTDVPRNYIQVNKIDEHIAAFKKAGGKEAVGKMEVPGMGWSYIGIDPEGNMIAMFEPKLSRHRTTRRRR
jgi:uncharacterized protein